MRSKFSVKYISIAIILLIAVLFSNTTIAQENEFDGIVITDLSGNEINEINENEYLKIGVLDIEQELTPYVIGVEIEFNGLQFTIDETTIDEIGVITLQAPEVDSDVSFDIIASKEGYNSTNTTITILNNETQEEQIQLFIESEYDTVEAGKIFRVTVKESNKDGEEVSGATVWIQSAVGTAKTTDDTGRAWLEAPDDRETIIILADKDGYIQGSSTPIGVNIEESWWIQLINSQYFAIIIALIFLIFAIIYVNRRQKRAIYSRAKEITDEKTLKKYDSEESRPPPDENNKKLNEQSSINDTVRVKPDQDPKVEEIRISRPRKEKEIVDVETEEDETEKVINKKKLQKRDYDWFEGTDDVRYEIDKLTGEVDEEGLDKWYEGIDDLKEKIDEKVKKKDKKKEGDK